MSAPYREPPASRMVQRIAMSLALFATTPAAWAQHEDAAAILGAAGVSPDGDGAVAYLRRLVPDAASRVRIDWLVAQLGSDRFATRERAQRELLGFGDAATSALADAARSPHAEIRTRAGRVLERIRLSSDARMRAALELLARDRPAGSTGVVLTAAGHGPDRMLDVVVTTLAAVVTEDDYERLVADLASRPALPAVATIRVLRTRFADRSTPSFRAALAHSDEVVRLEAAIALAHRSHRACLPALIELLRSEGVEIRARSFATLVAATDQRHGYAPFGEPDGRALAVERWSRWLRGLPESFALHDITRGERAPVAAYWISTSAQGLVRFDPRGKLLKRLDADAYDVEPTSAGLLLTERSANRVRLLAPDGTELRRIEGLSTPTDAELTSDGHILVLEGGENRVTEFSADGSRLRSFEGLSNPFDVQRLPGGNTLVADSGNNRLVEFSPDGSIVATIDGLAFPNGVHRVLDGRTIVTTYTSGEAVCVAADGSIAWRTKLGGTVYAPRRAGNRILIGCASENAIAVLDDQGRLLKKLALDWDQGFNDVGYDLGR